MFFSAYVPSDFPPLSWFSNIFAIVAYHCNSSLDNRLHRMSVLTTCFVSENPFVSPPLNFYNHLHYFFLFVNVSVHSSESLRFPFFFATLPTRFLVRTARWRSKRTFEIGSFLTPFYKKTPFSGQMPRLRPARVFSRIFHFIRKIHVSEKKRNYRFLVVTFRVRVNKNYSVISMKLT